LRWKDLDLDNNRLFIRRSVNEIRGEGLVYREPKNENSKRTVDFDDDVAASLKKFLKNSLNITIKKKLFFYTKMAVK
jgi:integrase